MITEHHLEGRPTEGEAAEVSSGEAAEVSSGEAAEVSSGEAAEVRLHVPGSECQHLNNGLTHHDINLPAKVSVCLAQNERGRGALVRRPGDMLKFLCKFFYLNEVGCHLVLIYQPLGSK
jgi:hypothetical protein